MNMKSGLAGYHHDLVNSYGISVTDDHGYVQFIVVTFPSSSMTCQRMLKENNTTCASSGAGTVYNSAVHRLFEELGVP